MMQPTIIAANEAMSTAAAAMSLINLICGCRSTDKKSITFSKQIEKLHLCLGWNKNSFKNGA